MKFLKDFKSFKLNEDNVPNKPTNADTEKSSSDYLKSLLTKDKLKKFKVVKESPYEIIVETSETTQTINISIAERGGDLDYKGTPVNFNNMTVEHDSQEVEKKFQWIKAKIEKMTSADFLKNLPSIQTDYTKRFPDSELSVRDVDGKKFIEYSHKFKENDNIAARDYTTDKNTTIAKGAKIPQNTKVIRFYVGSVENKNIPPNPTQKTYIQLTNKVINFNTTKINLPGGGTPENVKKIKDFYQLLVSVGFKGEDKTPILLINSTPMWIEKFTNYVDVIKDMNKKIKTEYNIDNFISPSDQELSRDFK